MTAKDILAKVKALFDAPIVPPAPAPPAPAPAPAPAPGGQTACSYNVDGGVPVFVNIADDGIPDIDTGDKVYTDAAMTIPYPDGTYNVMGTQFGFTVAAGSVASVNDAANTGPGTPIAAAAPAPPAPAPPPPAVPITQTQMDAMCAKFATGTADERISNLETMIKALMQCNFGYELQKISQAEAVDAYQNSIAMQLTASEQKIDEYTAKITEQELKIAKQDEIITGLFELTEAMVKEPTADPKTLTGTKKEQFDRQDKREKKFEGILAGLKEAKTTKKY